MQIDGLTMKNAPWSISKAKLAQNCSKQFRWKYVEKKTKDPEVLVKDSDSRVGIAIHSLLENCVILEDLGEVRKQEIKKNKLTITEVESLDEMYLHINHFKKVLTHFCRNRVLTATEPPNLLGALARDGKILPEIRFGLTKGFKKTGFFSADCFFRGVIDLLVLTKDGGAIIIDHKSASFATLKWYRTQLSAYKIAVCALYPDVRWVQCGIHFIPLKEIKWDDVSMRQDIEGGDTSELVAFLNEAAVEAEKDEISIGRHCKWCSYLDTCKVLRKELKKKPRAP